MPKEPDAVEDLPSPSNNEGGGGGGGGSMMPVILVIVLIPLITIGMFQFYMYPKIKELTDEMTKASAASHSGEHGGEHGEESYHGSERGEAVINYELNDIVANLRAPLRSRYIKVSITLESRVIDFAHIMDVNKSKILDCTIAVLQNLTLQDLDEPGIQNIVRSDLLNQYANALKGNVIDNLYFSSFVTQ